MKKTKNEERRTADAFMDRLVRRAVAEDAANGRRTWTPAEDAFIREHLGWLTDAEMGEALGRTETAVHLRWNRDLQLPGPSKSPEVITALKAAELLGIDGHKVAHWVDAGLIRGRLMAGGRKIRLIQREDLRRWALNPMNWVYFDIRNVLDEELHHLLAMRAKRWNNEWWPTERVAQYHGVDTSDVKRYIRAQRILAFQPQVSLGGRHPLRGWARWFVLKSEATRADLHFVKRGDDMTGLTPRGKAWMKKALRMGWRAPHIARSMKRSDQTVLNWIWKYFPAYAPKHSRKAVK